MFRRVLIAASFGEQFIIWLLWHNGRFSSMIINIIPGPYTSYIPQVLTAPSKGKSSRIIYYLSTLAQRLFFISYNILPQVLTAQYGPCSWQYNVACGMLPVFHQLLYIKTSTLAQWLFFISNNILYDVLTYSKLSARQEEIFPT